MRIVFCKLAVLAVGIVFANGAFKHVSAQTATSIESQASIDSQPPTNWRQRRAEVELEFKADLESIADWCSENDLAEKADLTRRLYWKRDLGRQYIFPPSELSMPQPGEGVDGEWLTKINAAKVRQAERILDLARQAADQDAGAVAFQWLHEVIFYDRDHAAVRKMFGHRKTPEGWRVAPDKHRILPVKKAHEIVNWPARQYLRMRTPHFIIESSASEERTHYLANQLERWHWIWRQVFLEYWSSSAHVKRWIGGSATVSGSQKRYRVVFFRDKAEYVRLLRNLVPGIEVSTGYYVSAERISFFYDGSKKDQDTWRHELTHQLFRESGRAKKDAFETQFIWLDEGIATYFESLTDFGDYVTLGGFESSRMQYARIRRLLEGFHIPLKELSSVGRADLQKQSLATMTRFYTEAASMADLLMNDQNGASEQALVEFLRLVYKGRVKSSSFKKVIGRTFAELDAAHLEFLKVDATVVARFLSQPNTRTELSMAGTELDQASFLAIGKCVNLTMLDLSNNSVRESDFQSLNSCPRIQQLILTRCRFEEGSLTALDSFPVLDDLDLSGSSVQDAQLASFGKLDRLRSLKLAQTAITDQGIQLLGGVTNLVELDVSGTQVTAQGIAKLKLRLPRLHVVQ